MDGISMPIRSNVRRTFLEIGNLCYAYPWEIILVATLLTIGILSSDDFWINDAIAEQPAELVPKSNEFDVVVLVATKCLIIAYCYLQMRRFALLGTRYEFGLAALLTVAQAYVFANAALARVYEQAFVLNDVLPVFLLLTDFTKVFSLARCVLVSLSVSNSPKHAIQFGLVACGPASCVDSALQILVIGLGMFSGNEPLERVCAFGCVAIALNLVMFVCYYPALLSLVFQLGSAHERERVLREIRALFVPETTDGDCEFEKRTNPVLQRIKVIMSAGLIVVHAQLRMLIHGNAVIERSVREEQAAQGTLVDDELAITNNDANVHVIEIPFCGTMKYRADTLFTFFLAFLLILKYTFLDNVLDDLAYLTVRTSARQRSSSNSPETRSNSIATSGSTQNAVEVATKSNSSPKQTIRTRKRSESTAAKEPVVQHSERARLTSGGELESLSDESIMEKLRSRQIASYTLESKLKPDFRRAIGLRRRYFAETSHDPQYVNDALERLPFSSFDDYATVHGVCCENVVGYVPLPVGLAGPLLVNGRHVYVPLATSEGGLVASTNRGCRAIFESCAAARTAADSGASSEYVGVGVRTFLTNDGMSRGPVLRFPSGRRAAAAREWLQAERNFELIKVEFDGTSRFASLKRVEARQVGRHLYLRFVAMTGDAMGMNMVSRATERVLNVLQRDHFADMAIVALSGNVCVDKKASAMNWIEGRGKSVTCETVLRANVVRRVLKTTVARMLETHTVKNLVGSAVAGAAFGGQNAHAANVIAAIYIACGQDAGQIVTSSSCLITMEREPRNSGRRTRCSTSVSDPSNSPNNCNGAAPTASGSDAEDDSDDDLYVSCTMPCLEVGVVGGGTILSAQRACLTLMGVRADDRDATVSSTGAAADTTANTADVPNRKAANESIGANETSAERGATRRLPGERASDFAMAVCSAVLAGELSLLAALSVSHLTEAHERLNRRKRT